LLTGLSTVKQGVDQKTVFFSERVCSTNRLGICAQLKEFLLLLCIQIHHLHLLQTVFNQLIG